MVNNKIVDNLNFIKIYFKEFIHKIIVPKKFELSGKKIKNHRLRMKTRLGARTRLKNPRNWVQKALEHERTFNIQEHYSALLECRSLALQKCQIGSFWVLAQLPLGDNKAHPFRYFRRRMSLDSRSTHLSYYLESSGLYK